MPPTLTTFVDLALVAFGAVLGALAFSMVIGRHRAHQLARLTDRLAQVQRSAGAQFDPELVAVFASLVAGPTCAVDRGTPRISPRQAMDGATPTR